MKKYCIVDDEKVYYFTLAELSKSITKQYAIEILSEAEYVQFCKLQDAFFENEANEMRRKSLEMHLNEQDY